MAARKKLTAKEEEEAVRAHVRTLSEEAWRDMSASLHLQHRNTARLRKDRDLPRLFKMESEVLPALGQRIEALEMLTQQQTAQIQDLQVSLGNALAAQEYLLAAQTLAPPEPQAFLPEPQCQTIAEVKEVLDWLDEL